MQSIRRLLCCPADELNEELLKAHNIYTSVADLGPKVWGFVYQCSKGHYRIVPQIGSGSANEKCFSSTKHSTS